MSCGSGCGGAVAADLESVVHHSSAPVDKETPLSRFRHVLKVMVLASCGGLFWMWGAGSCLPYNFYSNLLADSVISSFVSTIVSGIATELTPAIGA
jgi:hypothetical protein